MWSNTQSMSNTQSGLLEQQKIKSKLALAPFELQHTFQQVAGELCGLNSSSNY
jgi:hypothetical protein